VSARKKQPKTGSEKLSAVRRQSDSVVPVGAKSHGEVDVTQLVHDISEMIDAARNHVAVNANTTLVTLHWQVGNRVHTEVLDERRAPYGAQIVATTGRDLEARYGSGFNEKSLRHMIRFAVAFPDAEIVSALRRQLTWTHFKQLSYIEDELKRSFYAEMCRVEG
jgi:hypothetical protein